MEPNNANDFNAGAADPAAGVPDSGNPGDNAGQPSSDPGNQGGQNPDPRDTELAKYKEQNRILNQRLVESRRSQGQQPQNPQNNGNEDPNDPGYAYGVALDRSEGQIRAQLEPVLDLYPELPADIAKQIRSNVWAYVKRENMLGLNVPNALLDIEQYVADQVAGLSPKPAGQENGGNQPTPVGVNPNSAPEDNGGNEPDPMEDWSMPMDQLEQKVGKIKSKKTN